MSCLELKVATTAVAPALHGLASISTSAVSPGATLALRGLLRAAGASPGASRAKTGSVRSTESGLRTETTTRQGRWARGVSGITRTNCAIALGMWGNDKVRVE